MLPILDPVKNVAMLYAAPVPRSADAVEPGTGVRRRALRAPSPHHTGAASGFWETRANNHNSMFGRDGRLWMAASRARGQRTRHSARRARMIRRPRRSRWSAPCATSRCSIRRRRNTRSSRPATPTHHPQFGYDANDTLWTSGGGPVVGWLNTKMFDQTGDAAKSQGWTALVLDTNGNGKRDAYTEPY